MIIKIAIVIVIIYLIILTLYYGFKKKKGTNKVSKGLNNTNENKLSDNYDKNKFVNINNVIKFVENNNIDIYGKISEDYFANNKQEQGKLKLSDYDLKVFNELTNKNKNDKEEDILNNDALTENIDKVDLEQENNDNKEQKNSTEYNEYNLDNIEDEPEFIEERNFDNLEDEQHFIEEENFEYPEYQEPEIISTLDEPDKTYNVEKENSSKELSDAEKKLRVEKLVNSKKFKNSLFDEENEPTVISNLTDEQKKIRAEILLKEKFKK